jgi:hypothetical protein
MCINIYCTAYNTLDSYIGNAYKVAPPTSPPTMTLKEIFDQLMVTYGKPTPDVMHQHNLNFLAPYNPQHPPKILFKRCMDCQEITIIAKVPYTDKQLLTNVINLLTCSGLYTRNMEDWDRRADTNRTWLHPRPFIQMAYQRCLQSMPLLLRKEATPTGTLASPPKTTSPMTTWPKPSWGQLMRTWQTCWPKQQSPPRPMLIKSTCCSNSWQGTTTNSISSNRQSFNRWQCYLQTLLRQQWLERMFLEPLKSLLSLPSKGTISSTSSSSSSCISNSTNNREVVVAEVVAANMRNATGADKDAAEWCPSITLEEIR